MHKFIRTTTKSKFISKREQAYLDHMKKSFRLQNFFIYNIFSNLHSNIPLFIHITNQYFHTTLRSSSGKGNVKLSMREHWFRKVTLPF